MQTLKSITAVKPGDGFDHWHQVTCRNYSMTESRRLPDRHFRARVSLRHFGPLLISDLSSATTDDDLIRVTRSQTEIRRDARDNFILWLPIDGETVFVQGDRKAVMRKGDLVLHDQSQPFTLEFGRRSHAITLDIPRPLLISRVPMARLLVARSIGATSRLGALAGSVVRQLASLEDADEETMRRLSSSALDILATALEAALTDKAEAPGQQARLDQVKRYMLANMADPTLDLDRIAQAQSMAPRTLNRLFAGEGATPIRWLWQQRLAASFTALVEGRVGQVTDAALSFGFSDLSHFSRAFKAQFGHSPQFVLRQKRSHP
jgi:AraC-like DNA-binding protein